MSAIIDTSVVIPTDVDPLPRESAITAATLAEHFGILVTTDATVRAAGLRRLSELRHRFDALPVDDAVATNYSMIAAPAVAAGRQPRARVMDLLMAATAHAHGAVLYTLNADDFVGLDHLVEVTGV